MGRKRIYEVDRGSTPFMGDDLVGPYVQPVDAQTANHVVISEVYGGGGNSGSTYKNDFVELYNPTSSTVDMSGWSVQYASATGTSSWLVTNLTGTIAPHGSFWWEKLGTGGTVNLPTPDVPELYIKFHRRQNCSGQ